MSLTHEMITAQARSLGIDLVGVTRWAELEEVAPDYDRPLRHSTHLSTLLVLVKRVLVGVMTAEDEAARQFACGRTAIGLDEAAASLAYWLEEQGTMAAMLSSTVPDLRCHPADYSSPAGQGSLLLRHAAVRAGLGTFGLNTMVLTPQFGPRIFIAGLLTNLDLSPGEPMELDLCLGPQACGRCAKACPVNAIPAHAQAELPIASIMGIDGLACATQCQPFGAERMAEHFAHVFGAPTTALAQERARETTTRQLFHHIAIMRHGAYTGCNRCEQACPVGEDYPMIAQEMGWE